MHPREMSTLTVTLQDFRVQVAALGADVEMIATNLSSGRTVEAAGFTTPRFMLPEQQPQAARWRVPGAGSIALQRVLATWVPPSLEDVLDVPEVTHDEFWRSRGRFLTAAAAVAVELAVHARPIGREVEGGAEWRTVDPGDFPEQARELLPAARAALTECAGFYLRRMSMAGAPFMPGAWAVAR